MFSAANVAWNSFFEEIVGESRIGHEGILGTGFVCFAEPLDKFGIFVLQLLFIGGFHSLDPTLEVVGASCGFAEGVFGQVNGQ